MNLAAGKEKVISRTVAWMPPLVKQKGVKGYYFDFGRIYWHKPDKLPEKRSNGWGNQRNPAEKEGGSRSPHGRVNDKATN